MMETLTYLRLKTTVFWIRKSLLLFGPRPVATPDTVLELPSRDPGRTIKAHVYRPPTAISPTPVLLNFHGSGFVLPLHGSDDLFCRQVSSRAGYTVLDVQYRLAPEHPFPAAIHDVEDAINYILSHPELYDVTQFSLSGFSAGANLILATASSSSSNQFSSSTFRHLIAFYPPVDLATPPAQKQAPDPSGRPLPNSLANLFDECYMRRQDRKNPLISPLYASPLSFPKHVLIITAACDTLAPEAEALAANIDQASQGKGLVVCKRMAGVNHAWDKGALQPGSEDEKARDEAYAMAFEMLSR